MGAGRPFPSWTAARGFVVSCLLPLNFPLISLFLCLSLPLSLCLHFCGGRGGATPLRPLVQRVSIAPGRENCSRVYGFSVYLMKKQLVHLKVSPPAPPPPRPPLGFHSPSSQQGILTLGRISAPLMSHQLLYSTHLRSCSSYPFHTRIPAQTWDFEYRTIPDLTRVDP